MKSTFVLLAAVVLPTSAFSTGCASIISGRRADVAFDSYPTNAHVVVHDNDGHAVASCMTPGVVSLNRNRKYFLPARYTATMEAPGYEPVNVPIRSTANPWVLGNIVLGGIPGLVIDNLTGAAWQPKTKEIHRQLTPLMDESSTVSASDALPNDMPPEPEQPAAFIADRPGTNTKKPVQRR